MKDSTCTVVVGGQYGSEGKGKVVSELISGRFKKVAVAAVRPGGPNSGHTAHPKGKEPIILKQLPSGCVFVNGAGFIPAGAVVDTKLLEHEIGVVGLLPYQITVDPRAVQLKPLDKATETATVQQISGTGSGNGSALIRRMSRLYPHCTMDRYDPPYQKPFTVQKVAPILHDVLDNHHFAQTIVIEGNQGFGLSLLHGPSYPFTTSRDVTAAAFASECGLAPSDVSNVVLTIRTFPIRVGNAGPKGSGFLKAEMSWEEVAKAGGWPEATPEYTSVTNRLRRVGAFDLKMVQDAVRYNGATEIAVMGIDRLNAEDRGCTESSKLSEKSLDWLNELMDRTGVPVTMIGTAPDVIVDLQAELYSTQIRNRGRDYGKTQYVKRDGDLRHHTLDPNTPKGPFGQ